MYNSTFPPIESVYINASFSIIITVIAIGGNLAMILIFFRVKDLQDLNNTAITFLATSDFVRGCIIMTAKVHNQFYFVRRLGEPACTFTAIVCGFTFVFSPMTLALIGVVRYCKVVPRTRTNFDLSKRRFYGMITVVFILATMFAFLPVTKITGRYTYSPSHGVCFAEWHPENEVFRTIFYVIVIGLAFPVLTICYFLLFRALRQHNKNITEGVGVQTSQVTVDCTIIENDKACENHLTGEGTIKGDNGHTNSHYASGYTTVLRDTIEEPQKKATWKQKLSTVTLPYLFKGKKKELSQRDRYSTKTSITSQERFSRQIWKQERQVTRLMMIIFVAYCLCWIPAAIVNAMAIYHKHRAMEKKVPLIYKYVIVTLVELKCALNPLIYGLGNRKYRRALREMGMKLNCCKVTQN